MAVIIKASPQSHKAFGRFSFRPVLVLSRASWCSKSKAGAGGKSCSLPAVPAAPRHCPAPAPPCCSLCCWPAPVSRGENPLLSLQSPTSGLPVVGEHQQVSIYLPGFCRSCCLCCAWWETSVPRWMRRALGAGVHPVLGAGSALCCHLFSPRVGWSAPADVLVPHFPLPVDKKWRVQNRLDCVGGKEDFC